MSKYWSANFLASDLRPLGSVHRHLSLHEAESTNKEKEAFRAFLKGEELDNTEEKEKRGNNLVEIFKTEKPHLENIWLQLISSDFFSPLSLVMH